MLNIPVKVTDRLIAGIKKFQPILTKARDRDINESDTVVIINDVLSEVFGYDKFEEITSELTIKHTFCDLAIKLDGVIRLIIEVKAAGMVLKEQHTKQAADYGSNSGVDWVILTNGIEWKVYKITFGRPINLELVYEFDFTKINVKKQGDLELLYYLTKESMVKSSKASLDDFHLQKQLVNRFTIGQLLLSETVLDSLRKQLKKLAVDAKISNDEVKQILVDEIIKREVFDGDKAIEAKKKVDKMFRSQPKTQPNPKHDSSKTDSLKKEELN